jgi:replicative DNA helicase Mcm
VTMEVELSGREAYVDFLRNYRDRSGSLKYMERIRRMINLRQKSLIVDYLDLYTYRLDLAMELVENPQRSLKDFADAIREIVLVEDPEYAEKTGEFYPRIRGLPETTPIRSIRADYIGRLVQIEGIVTRVTPIKEKMIKAAYRHVIQDPNCDSEIFLYPEEGELEDRLERPIICPRCQRSGGKFELIREKSVFVDWQKISVQEKPEETPGGQLPRSIEVRLTRDLVDIARPGDRVTIVGIVRLSHDSQTKPYFTPFIEAISVNVSQKMLEEVVITREDEEKIRELASDPWIVQKIVLSIAPSLYGMWSEKESIAYLLFGGVPKFTPDGTRIRGDIHVLLVGDPGTGKSQILQSAVKLAPRGVYTSGKGSTAAGLTAAVLRDTTTGEWYLEAGALVIADGGIAAIDEIDKMREEDRSAIHEAMEQQTVSIAKAGIVASLNSRTSVLAAGNPKFGRYDESLSIPENLNLPPPIVSRFDLIWLLKDKPNEKKDRALAEYVLNVHSDVDKFAPPINPDLLKKYISYARRYIKPRISREAAKLIEEFYVNMRKKALEIERAMESGGPPLIPITTRQLEALIRLTEAHARLKLKQVADEEDAEAAIRLMDEFLHNINLDVETGLPDIDSLTTGRTRRKREIIKMVTKIIKELSSTSEKKCALIDDIYEKAKTRDITVDEVKEVIGILSREGSVFYRMEKNKKCYSLVE